MVGPSIDISLTKSILAYRYSGIFQVEKFCLLKEVRLDNSVAKGFYEMSKYMVGLLRRFCWENDENM